MVNRMFALIQNICRRAGLNKIKVQDIFLNFFIKLFLLYNKFTQNRLVMENQEKPTRVWCGDFRIP